MLIAGTGFLKRAGLALSTSLFLCGLLVAGTAVDAAAENWPVVLRPGINFGTGSADLNVSAFAPVYQTNRALFFFTPNFRYNDGANENEFNIGAGVRSLIGDESYLGANIFYDQIRSRYSHNFHQIGLGIEGRSRWFDATLNGHIPVGDRQEGVNENDRMKIVNLTLVLARGKEEQLPGVDGEVGVLIPVVSDFVETRAYLGGYYWKSDLVGDIGGVKARVEIRPVPLLTLNATYDYDNEFESTWRGEAYLNIPFDISGGNPFASIGDYLKFGQGPRSVSERMTDRVERDRYIILVEGNGDFRAVESIPK